MVECHLARANPHLKDLAEGNEALMIFQGAEGYITPNWYQSKTLHGKVVPTWNYAVVHAYGRPEVMQEKDWLRRHVNELAAQQERNEPQAWMVTDAPANYIDVMLRGIVGFRFPVTRLEGKVEDEPESRLAGPRRRRQGSRPARRRRRPGDGGACLALYHAEQLRSD